jgi:hypothetical protein
MSFISHDQIMKVQPLHSSEVCAITKIKKNGVINLSVENKASCI